MKSKKGIKAIIKVLCQTDAVVEARQTYSAWINIAQTEARPKEKCERYAFRFHSAYCFFTELHPNIVLPSIMTELLGFQLLKGAKLDSATEGTVIKHAMMHEKERQAKKAAGLALEALDMDLQDLMSSDDEEDPTVTSSPDAASSTTASMERELETVKCNAEGVSMLNDAATEVKDIKVSMTGMTTILSNAMGQLVLSRADQTVEIKEGSALNIIEMLDAVLEVQHNFEG